MERVNLSLSRCLAAGAAGIKRRVFEVGYGVLEGRRRRSWAMTTPRSWPGLARLRPPSPCACSLLCRLSLSLSLSLTFPALQVDAYVCGETESLRSRLAPERVLDALVAASAAGFYTVVEELLTGTHAPHVGDIASLWEPLWLACAGGDAQIIPHA